ncbi:tRNA 1-methyladenosine methyltransferase subunit GCD10 [Aspergillus affinis]|uniref:tRNA 1-methyladenosine methyltransferase subunit GCD10 n=1 Tax=Aspergillus affinis TaxID=1070780 RepID=UPI0022FE05D8|nr:putative eukaryotic translation initiation factor 3 [Aspergillus affinis]KAI9042074.1 putative eukaryotic translation initiation factor 3 [Aspergillus affinis]
MHSYIRPHQHVALRLPSDSTKIVKVVPNTMIFLGKYGSFPSNQIIGRPFYLTFEILSNSGETDNCSLRIISAAEIHAESLITEGEGFGDAEGDDDVAEMNMDQPPVRTNREIQDDNSAQSMTVEEIEALKKESSGAGREIIAKLLESHSALDQKTAFSLAKYTLRKRKKYMKRFTVLPLDVSLLTNYMLFEKDASKTLELRDELLGLLGCWGNVHHGSDSSLDATLTSTKPNGRYLVIDDTGGLVVAAMAERMGILYPHDGEDEEEQTSANEPLPPKTEEETEATEEAQSTANNATPKRPNRRAHMSARDNTITLVHANMQANLSLLKHFGYEQDNPDPTHPLYAHLKTVSWLQLIDPSADSLYSQEPPVVSDSELATLKPNKRSTYYRKRNRWMRVQKVVDEVRAGGYDGLVVASLSDPDSLLKHAVPLLAGSAQVAVYSPTIEPLTQLMDLYSTPRKTAFLNKRQDLKENQQQQQSDDQTAEGSAESQSIEFPELIEEFFLDPSLLLAPTLETSRVRHWQVLPGRTHPLMSGRGGAEGYVFHAVRVVPTQAAVHAAGNSSRKKRKITQETPTATADSASGMDVDTK